MEPNADQPKAPGSKPAHDKVAKKAYAIFLKEEGSLQRAELVGGRN